MKEIEITVAQIERILNEADISVCTYCGKVTVMLCKLKNGFVITESFAVPDGNVYDTKLGVEICEKRIHERLWELEEYAMRCKAMEEWQEVER